MARGKRSSEQRYYVTPDEADVVQRAAEIVGQSKSDYARQAVLAAAIAQLANAGESIPQSIRFHGSRRVADPVAESSDTNEIIEAFDVLRELLVKKIRPPS